ncbi:MAG: hypothetical protein A2X49_12385 [Lentisphaerae bacterium GWF2_52_8]|nr:MAG: hypothetical protein A2X49_12385 [Lentisphaerae bacterium GWF2_52_8]
MSRNDDLELIESFVAESQDMIDTVEPMLLGLKDSGEGCAADKEAINAVFRLFHSMKGAAGFLKMENISAVTHQAETLLDIFRHKDVPMDSSYIEVELEAIDAIRTMLELVTKTQSDKGMESLRDTMTSSLKDALRRAELAAGMGAGKPACPQGKEPECEKIVLDPVEEPQSGQEILPELTITPEMAVRFSQEAAEILEQAEQGLLSIPHKTGEDKKATVSETFRAIHSFKGNCGFMQLSDLEHLSHKMENVLDAMRSNKVDISEQNVDILLKTLDVLRNGLCSFSRGEGGELFNCELMMEFLEDLLPKEESKDSQEPAAKLQEAPSPSETGLAGAELKATGTGEIKTVRRDIRVDLEKLDNLINLVGELVIAEAMVLRHPALRTVDDETFDRAVHHLKRISSNLQDVSMSVRMIPLSATFRKMIRLVHDLSLKSGKKAGLELIGEETEVDKNVIEQISDPLVHIIRNSLDHGLEAPAERSAAEKPEKGIVTIAARHDGGEVVITVSDDGRGLNREKIIAKAVKQGLFNGDPSQLSDEEAYQFIFEPGFSTADKVTDISGRGVGMDVVKKNIEKLNGRVTVKSNPGKGSDISLHIPLTLAIIDGMLVRVGSTQYTIPMLSIKESLKANTKQITVRPDGCECVRLREELIPVLRLHHLYRKEDAETELTKGILVVVEADQEAAALLIDEIVGQQEIVIKGLSSYLGRPMGISGCTVLGDGSVSLIIDVGSLLRSAAESGFCDEEKAVGGEF